MTVKLRDIATRLNLSPSLVSGVLNDRPGIWASEETRRRIRRTARELGYRPNAAARALRIGKTHTVALVYLDSAALGHVHPGLVVDELARYLGSCGYELLIKVCADQERLLTSLEELVFTQTCDAVILWGREADVQQQGRILEELGMPFVIKGRHEEQYPHWPQVDFDHEGMMAIAVSHLASLGHRRIAYVGYASEELYCLRLLEGYYAAHQKLFGAEPPAGFVFAAPDHVEIVRAKMLDWLALPPPQQPTAAVIGAGNAAWQGIELALATVGRRIGSGAGEFAVAGESHQNMQLLFGNGYTFERVELTDLAHVMARQLLWPLLAGQPLEKTVLRVLPTLRQVESLQLLNYVSFCP
ncbi:MAG TPA: LacI family DNA-binding transcriptional regulator [Chthonomonadaceae bacterium]|nr:LacI family DNA-binding transcriptional regulator [Chthonomonadaceae bacterium]